MSPEFENQQDGTTAEVAGSWKEIAAFFDVSVRTVQLWEGERGLPVRRHPGGRGRVFAYVAELQAWRDGTLTQALISVTVYEPAPPAPRPAPRRRWMISLAALVALIAIAIFALVRSDRATPSAYRVEGQSLIVSDQEGRVLWTHRFDSEVTVTWNTDPSRSRPIFKDIEDDGEVELLFPFNSTVPWGAHNGALFCFSSSGSVRWVFRPDRTVDTAKGRFAPPYHLRLFALVPDEAAGSPQRIFVAATHVADCPSQAVLLDHRGRLLREYWHSGHYNSVLVTDLSPGYGPEIYLGTVSNAARQSSIIALDPRNFEGAAREENPDYQILGFPAPRELGRVLLPRMRGGRLHMFDSVSDVARTGDRLIASVIGNVPEPPLRHVAYQAYFGHELNLVDVVISSSSYSSYRNLHAQGLLAIDNPDIELPELRKVRYLTPWTPQQESR